jgi:hypothetical protein
MWILSNLLIEMFRYLQHTTQHNNFPLEFMKLILYCLHLKWYTGADFKRGLISIKLVLSLFIDTTLTTLVNERLRMTKNKEGELC